MRGLYNRIPLKNQQDKTCSNHGQHELGVSIGIHGFPPDGVRIPYISIVLKIYRRPASLPGSEPDYLAAEVGVRLEIDHYLGLLKLRTPRNVGRALGSRPKLARENDIDVQITHRVRHAPVIGRHHHFFYKFKGPGTLCHESYKWLIGNGLEGFVS